MLYRRPMIFDPFNALTVAESTRRGGVSPAPYASLNLGFHTPDQPEHVRENRRRLLEALGWQLDQLAESHQVHGKEVLVVEAAGSYQGHDALVTNRPGILLGIKIADCTPILLFDPVRRVIGAAHAGWRGAAAGVVGRTLEVMAENFGVRPGDCFAYVGVCMDAASYEVDADVADHFPAAFKRWAEARGKFLLDLKGANRAQLRAAGLPEAQIEVSAFSTVLHNEDYFSHRKEKGRTGRQMALIGLAE